MSHSSLLIDPRPATPPTGAWPCAPMAGASVGWWTGTPVTDAWGAIYRAAYERAVAQSEAAARVELWRRQSLPGVN